MLNKPVLKARELFAMVVLLIGIKFSDMTSVLLAQKGKNAFWMMPIISFIVVLPSLLLFMHVLKTNKDKNLIEIIKSLFGKKLGGGIGLVLFIIGYIALGIDSRNTVDVLGTIYFQESPTIILYFIFMLFCFFGARYGFQVIGSTAYLILPYIKIAVAMLALLILKDVIWLRVFPIFGPGLKPLLIESVKKASIYSELFFLAMAYTSFKDTKTYHKGLWIGSIFSVCELTVFFLLYCTLFDYKSIDKNGFLFHEVTQYLSIGLFFTNIETFFMAFWLIGTLIRFIIYLYFLTWIFAEIFSIKNFIPLMIPFAYLTITIGMIPENSITNVVMYRDTFLTMITPLILSLPFILWIATKIKGVGKTI